jgi:alkaline phosphatase
MNARTLAAAAAAAAIVASSAAAAPKNVILMVADGWGYNSIQAANFWTGAAAQSFEKFPVHFATSTFSASGHGYDPARAWVGNTYNTDYLKTGATDSASAITAMLTGVKNYDGILNISVDGQPLTTFAQMYKAAGRAAGAVSTVQWSHATPAGTYAHNRRDNYAEIALEGIASDMDVIFGAGNPDFDNNGQPASMNPRYVGGAEA